MATGLISELCTTDTEQSVLGGCAGLLPTGRLGTGRKVARLGIAFGCRLAGLQVRSRCRN